MVRPLNDTDLLDIGGFLLEGETVVPSDEALWADCEDGRARTCINRAYYGAFLALKRRLLAVWPSGDFPTHDVHAKLGRALARELGHRHQLVSELRALLDERKDADYQPGYFYTARLARGLASRSAAVITAIQALTPAQIKAIAGELHRREYPAGSP